MRILHVIPTYFPAVRYGGPIRSVHGLSTALARRGHEVHVYTTNMDGESNLEVPLNEPVDLDGVQVHYFPVPGLRRLCWSPAMSGQLRRSAGSFDVLHLHSVFLWPTRAGARAAASAGVPYVVAPRGMLIRDMIQRKSHWVKSLWISLVERESLERARALHVTAELEGEELRALFGNSIPEIVNIPNGVDGPSGTVSKAQTVFPGLPSRYALFLSRISWKKGLDRLIEAWREVPEVPLVIAGNDEEGYQGRLEQMVSSMGLASRVHFIGAVSDRDKWALYEGADLFVLPSYSENFGNVVAEAMFMGCPVVISPDVGIAELVSRERAGVVTRCDPPVLAQVVRSLLADPDRMRELGDCGRKVARQQLSWDGVAARTEDLYRSLAS